MAYDLKPENVLEDLIRPFEFYVPNQDTFDNEIFIVSISMIVK